MDDLILLEKAIIAAIQGSEKILEVYSGSFSVDLKEDRTPLTEADRKAHTAISGVLSATGLPVLSEEGRNIPYEERRNWERFWLVDPLDGTKEFIKRNGEFTVNIALVEKGKPVMGVILVPVTNELYFGNRDTGAKKIQLAQNSSFDFNRILEFSKPLPAARKPRPYTVVCSRSHLSNETERHIETLKKTYPDLEYASKGSSLKLCLIAEGAADEYPRFAPTMEWDTAAGHALVELSGGRVIRTDDQEDLVYNKRDLLNPWFIALKA